MDMSTEVARRYVYLPNKINLEELEKEFPVFEGYIRDKAKLILHWITNNIKTDSWGYLEEDDWTPLYSPIIQQNGIKDFPMYRDWLLKAGVIESDGSYHEGKSRCYRIAFDYLSPTKPRVIRRWTLIKKIDKVREERLEAVKTFPELWGFMKGLQFSTSEANRAILSDFRIKKEGNIRKDYKSLNFSLKSIRDFRADQWQFFQGEKSGRLFSNVTFMPKIVRRCLHYREQQLVEVDIKNSQPFMANIILKKAFWEEKHGEDHFTIYDFKKSFGNRLFNSIIGNVMGVSWEGDHISTLMLAKNPTAHDILDFTVFSEISQKGLIYEHMVKDFKGRFGITKSRDDMKKGVLQAMYSDNRFFGLPDARLKRAFRDLFPRVYDVMAAIKRSKKNNLAILLQSVERKLFLERIVPRLLETHPEVPVFTIHDAIVTLRGYEDSVKEVIREEAEKAIGRVPSLGVEAYTKP